MSHNALIIGSLKPVPAQVLECSLLDRISVITEPECAHYYDSRVEVLLVDSVDDFTAVREAALTILADHPVDAVLTPTEFGVATGGLLRSHYGIGGMDFETAHAFSNKYVMKRKLAAAGIPVAPFRQVYRLELLPAAADELGWPVVVKPVFGSGTVGVAAIASAAGFAEYVESAASADLRAARFPLVAEQYLDIEAEYHCDGVVMQGRTEFAATSRYLAPVLRGLGGIQGSYHLPQTHPDAIAVRELHDAAVAALGMKAGVTHLEVLRTPHGFLVGEVACRPGGGGIVRGVELQYGVDLWRAHVETSLGVRPTLDVVARESTVVNVMLPASAGRITRLTGEKELAAVPGVTEVVMFHGEGDVISDVMYSTNITGVVFLAAPTLADVDQLVRGLKDVYASESASESPDTV
ncbi:hypothetical protein [Streptomyces sp. NPDC059215]|uniref:ATP-binding protein n=1 Tax=Streptomyces sp. NPDC059215 TaxID=3346772 RepID=UPI0036C624F8